MLNDITITDICRVITVYSPKGRKDTINNRKTYGMSFCTEGQITYNHLDRSVISDPNQAVLLPKGQTYSISGNKTGAFAVIDFCCVEDLCDTVIPIEIHNSEGYMHDFEKMKYLSLFDGNRAEIISIFYHIIYKLCSQNSPSRAIMPAVKYIENNYCDPSLSNEVLARQCMISEVYFRRMFTEHYKMTPKQFIIDIRINKAKQLLSEGTLKINAIATQCGFSNQYHFDRVFREKTGVTPSEYMKQNLVLKI